MCRCRGEKNSSSKCDRFERRKKRIDLTMMFSFSFSVNTFSGSIISRPLWLIPQKIGNWFEMIRYLKPFLKFLLLFGLWTKNENKISEITPNDVQFSHIVQNVERFFSWRCNLFWEIFERFTKLWYFGICMHFHSYCFIKYLIFSFETLISTNSK